MALVGIAPATVLAQSASPWLAPDHWAVRAVSHLHALGMAPPGFDASAREHTAAEVATALRHAWLTAAARVAAAEVSEAFTSERDVDGVDPAALLRLVDGYVRRLADDRPHTFARAFGVARRASSSFVHAELAAGVAARDGALLAGGFDLDRNWIEPRPLPDYTAVAGTAEVSGVWRDRVALTLRGSRQGSAGRIERLTVDAAAGVVSIWAGRRAAAYSPLSSGGLVMSGDVAFEGAGIRLTRPATLPLLGALRAETFVGVLDPNGHVERPWLWGMRVYAQPHARLAVGVTRVAVFGALADARVGLEQVAEVVVGANLSGDFADDQVASLDLRWRAPLRFVPLELYGEWGAHDIDAGVLIDVPAFGIGARVAALPFAPQLGIALEHVQISRSCCENPPWYHHFELANGWTEDGVPLGHPLGGHGREWRATLDGALIDARLMLELHAFRRVRGDENLFTPDRAGVSRGVSAWLSARPLRRVTLHVTGAIEHGAGWRETSAAALLAIRR